jgi:hypothetical protein
MAALEGLGAASGIITILETSVTVFRTIVNIASSLAQYSEKTSAIIQQCNFDASTLKNIIDIFNANPSLLHDEADRKGAEEVFYQLQISLFKTKARLEPYQEGTLINRLLWSVAVEKIATEVERDLFQWSQRLYMRLSILISQLQGLLASPNTSPLLRIPEVMSQYRMNEIVTKAKHVQKADLERSMEGISLLGKPSSRMMASLQDGRRVFVEFRAYESPADKGIRDAAEETAVRLAAILSYAQPALMNILQCNGYYHDVGRSRFALLFNAPSGVVDPSDFVSLDELIIKQRRFSLGKRFEIARRIAAAVFVTHGVGWVHKAIQARRVMVCLRGDSTSSEAYLTGFEEARDKQGLSKGTESDLWHERLYRHPDRQADQGNVYYTPAHDIYSLGVVLLEIARWQIFAKEKKNERFVFECIEPHLYRSHLIERYLPGVSHYVGETYAEVVRDCLSVDRSKGMKLISHILSRLEQLVDVI